MSHHHKLLYRELFGLARDIKGSFDPNDIIESGMYLAEKMTWMLPDIEEQKVASIRFAKELDSFEIQWLDGNMIPREKARDLAIGLLRALDEAEQISFTCEVCFAEQGWFQERGFRRCNKCGYPGQ